MKGEEPKPMRTQTLEAEVRGEEHDYLIGFHDYTPGTEDRKTYKIVSAPFAHPDNREYNGE